jgi:hypothetical protein
LGVGYGVGKQRASKEKQFAELAKRYQTIRK